MDWAISCGLVIWLQVRSSAHEVIRHTIVQKKSKSSQNPFESESFHILSSTYKRKKGRKEKRFQTDTAATPTIISRDDHFPTKSYQIQYRSFLLRLYMCLKEISMYSPLKPKHSYCISYINAKDILSTTSLISSSE